MGAGIEIGGRIQAWQGHKVAPFVGAGIEIKLWLNGQGLDSVAPFVGAGIEIRKLLKRMRRARSHPSWVRGLKSDLALQ